MEFVWSNLYLALGTKQWRAVRPGEQSERQADIYIECVPVIAPVILWYNKEYGQT